MSRIDIVQEPYITAPAGAAVYARATYTRAGGSELLESVRHELWKQFCGATCWRRSPDNGNTWTEEEPPSTDAVRSPTTECYPHQLFLDEQNDVLIALLTVYDDKDDYDRHLGIGSQLQRTRRCYYQLSHDGGVTWTALQQVIDERPEFDATHWAPHIHCGTTGGIPSGQPVFLPDGTFVIGVIISHPEADPRNTTPRALEHHASIIYAQARLTADRSALVWRFGDEITIPYPLSSEGCCEPALCHLGGTRLFNSMRCQGDEAEGIYTTRYSTVSEDGGLTWSEPAPLLYDDGERVHMPASFARFFHSSKTDKQYLIGNIIDRPVYAQTPRYPLCIAEFDVERVCVLRDTVSVIKDRPADAPEDRRYSNWGQLEERGSGDLLLTMPEQPGTVNFAEITHADQYTSHCIRFRVRFVD